MSDHTYVLEYYHKDSFLFYREYETHVDDKNVHHLEREVLVDTRAERNLSKDFFFIAKPVNEMRFTSENIVTKIGAEQSMFSVVFDMYEKLVK